MKIQKKQEIEFFGTKTGNANSIALGYATETKNFGEVAVGVMNKSTAAKDPNSSKGVCVDPDATLFSVGCGGSGERKNALEVKGDGSVIIPGENGNINIADKIKQAFDTDASIELVKSAENSLQYTLMVNNESRGSINIPKDQFLKNVTYDSEGKQLVFTFITLDEDEHVEKVPVGDLKDIYKAGEGITINGDNVISADFSSVMTAISDEKTLRETTDNEIKSTLDTKANITDVDNRLSDLSNYCFKLGPDGRISTPFNDNIFSFDKKIQQLNNNEEYTYADISEILNIDEQQFIYDKTFNKFIKIIEIGEGIINTSGDFFRTVEPLDLTHTFYLDNEKTGIVENLTQLNIEASNVFVNLPYVEVGDILDDDTAPQYIYDATDNKWIEVIETYYVSEYNAFNTEEPLDLTHELYCSSDSSLFIKWTLVEPYSIALGSGSYAKGSNSIALGSGSSTNEYYSIALGCDTIANGNNSIALGCDTIANGNSSIVLGNSSSTNEYYSIALGCETIANGNRSIALGSDASANGNRSIVLGSDASANSSNSIALGSDSSANGNNSIALGYNANAGVENNTTYSDCITIGSNSKVIATDGIVIGHNSIVNCGDTPDTSFIIGSNSKTDFEENIIIGRDITSKAAHSIIIGNNTNLSKSACYSINLSGAGLMEMDRDNYGLYLKGFGGYDGTNLVVKNGDTETLNPVIKSVQEVINEKADTSAIPTKVSQLTNDANFITSYTETDPVWTREKANYYTKTEIDNKGYLTQHQPLDNYVTKSTADANYLSLANGGDIKNEVTISKANATNDDYTLHLANEGLYIGQDNGFYSIVAITPRNFAYRDFLFYVDENQFSFNTCFAVKRNDENNGGKNTIQLGEVLITESSLSRLNLALDNITAASTAEEVVTKFNALLADLKNKGLMEADVTA